jgi:UDP-N-acetylmuramyl pentapeptide synthase
MNHKGEIAPLSRMVEPDIAIITTIAPSHIGNMGSLEDIADEKCDIFAGLNKNGKALFVEVENKAFVLPLNIEGKLATITGMVVKDTNTNKIKVLAKAINIQ